jgi:G3E family GTPase
MAEFRSFEPGVEVAGEAINDSQPTTLQEDWREAMKKVPLVFFVGGFLGAGKTTAIRSLAEVFADSGQKVAAITNDQAAGLVDTAFLSGSGITAREVAGSCFCCNFNGLSNAILESIESENPDVILAEPVGSCTDIVATVIRPMRALMGEKVSIAAYSVLIEPKRWLELGGRRADGPWSMKFLFDKQLDEADLAVVTKADTLTNEELEDFVEQVSREYPSTAVLAISAKEKVGLQKWVDLVRATHSRDRWLKDIDYDTYALAEAEMGWLNAQVSVKFRDPVDGRFVAGTVLERLVDGFAQRKGRIGHVKIFAAGESGSVKVGVTQIGTGADLDGGFAGPVANLDLTINARATLEPEDLSNIVQDTVQGLLDDGKTQASILYMNSFKPSPPNPTYRFNKHE